MARNGIWLGEKHDRMCRHCKLNKQENLAVVTLRRRPPVPGPYSVRYKVQSRKVGE
jgi:hypothetical protein